RTRDRTSLPGAGCRRGRPLSLSSCATGAGNDLLWVDEGHPSPQLAAHAFDLLRGVLTPTAVELWPPLAILVDPRRREGTVPNLLEQLSHCGARLVGDDAWSRDVVPIFRRIGDGVTHVVQAALIEQIDDQFQLVHALEVGDLRLIARLDERVEAGFDERGHTPAEHGLLAEEIRLGLFGEGRLQHAGARTAEPLGIGERVGESATGCVLVYRDQS